jgi:hypothetical protein
MISARKHPGFPGAFFAAALREAGTAAAKLKNIQKMPERRNKT